MKKFIIVALLLIAGCMLYWSSVNIEPTDEQIVETYLSWDNHSLISYEGMTEDGYYEYISEDDNGHHWYGSVDVAYARRIYENQKQKNFVVFEA